MLTKRSNILDGTSGLSRHYVYKDGEQVANLLQIGGSRSSNSTNVDSDMNVRGTFTITTGIVLGVLRTPLPFYFKFKFRLF